MKNLLLLLVAGLMLIATVTSAMAYTIDGDTVYINDSNVYITASPHTITEPSWVTFTIESKQFTGDVNLAFLFEQDDAPPTDAEYYNPNTQAVQYNRTCDTTNGTHFFNYTTDPKVAYCYQTVNETLLWNQSFDSADLETETIFWSEDELIGWQDAVGGFSRVTDVREAGDTVYYRDGVGVAPGVTRTFRMYIEPTTGTSGKYDFGIWPSSYGANKQGIQDANQAGQLYLLDPWWNQTESGGSGGTITTNATHTIHTFTSSGTFSVPNSGDVSVFVVAGGGGGGGSGSGAGGGGGGGGGIIYNHSKNVTGGTSYTITVGAGGSGGAAGTNDGSNGGDSTALGLTAKGGGGGGYGTVSPQRNGVDGGNGGGYGGGNSACTAVGGTSTQGSTGGTGLGYDGADNPGDCNSGVGGAGGGGSGDTADGDYPIVPTAGYDYLSNEYSIGGGNTCADATGQSGRDGYGDGGNGTCQANAGGDGGDGTVIISYLTAEQLPEFRYAVNITVNSSEVDSDLTDFPVYVNMSAVNFNWSNFNEADCGDLRVTNSTGGELPRELVSCRNQLPYWIDPDYLDEFWFKADLVAGNNTFYLKKGGDVVPNGEDTFLWYDNASTDRTSEYSTATGGKATFDTDRYKWTQRNTYVMYPTGLTAQNVSVRMDFAQTTDGSVDNRQFYIRPRMASDHSVYTSLIMLYRQSAIGNDEIRFSDTTDGPSLNNTAVTWSYTGDWYRGEFLLDGLSAISKINRTQNITYTLTTQQATNYIGFGTYVYDGELSARNLIIREYTVGENNVTITDNGDGYIITVTAPKDLNNYSVLVNGTDLGVVSATESWIVRDNSTVGELHFKADSISSSTDTNFTIYYGSPTATDYAVTDTYGRNNVWSDYEAVYHLSDVTDSSGNTDATNSGVSFDNFGGAGDSGLWGTSESDYMTAVSTTAVKSLVVYAKADTGGAGYFVGSSLTNTNDGHLYAGFSGGSPNARHYSCWKTNCEFGSTGYDDDSWRQFVIVANSTSSEWDHYVNGTYIESNTAATSSVVGSGTMNLGRATDTGTWFYASGLYMDEVRFATTEFTGEWMAAESSNMLQNDVFLSSGSEVDLNGTPNTAPTLTTPVNTTVIYANTTANFTSTYTDDDSNVGNVTFYFWVNDSLVSTQTYTNQANGTTIASWIASGNFTAGDTINVTVEAYDGTEYGTNQTTQVTVTNGATVFSNVEISAFSNSTNYLGDNTTFNIANLTAIELTQVNFTVSDSDGFNDFSLFFTAGGSNGCALGNLQSNTCINHTNFIEFNNGTATTYFDGTSTGNAGDTITCTHDNGATTRAYSCLIDEHYNPNVFKWYSAGYNFSDVKYQTGNNERLHKGEWLRVLVNNTNIPVDAPFYKLDFRIQTTGSPVEPINAYACNSSYSTGDPSLASECSLIAQRTDAQLQDNGEKFRAIFTDNLISTLGDIQYIMLSSDENSQNDYYALKTYAATTGGWTTKWDYSVNDGTTWTNSADGYESELNINWVYNNTPATTTVYKFGITDSESTVTNSSEFNVSWSTGGGEVNTAPIVDITSPAPNETVSGIVTISGTSVDAQDDNFVSNVTISNSTNSTIIGVNVPKGTNEANWTTTDWSNGWYNITVQTCENETAELLCGNDTHEVLVFNAGDPQITGVNIAPDPSIRLEDITLTGTCTGYSDDYGSTTITSFNVLITAPDGDTGTLNMSTGTATYVSTSVSGVHTALYTCTDSEGASVNTSTTFTTATSIDVEGGGGGLGTSFSVTTTVRNATFNAVIDDEVIVPQGETKEEFITITNLMTKTLDFEVAVNSEYTSPELIDKIVITEENSKFSINPTAFGNAEKQISYHIKGTESIPEGEYTVAFTVLSDGVAKVVSQKVWIGEPGFLAQNAIIIIGAVALLLASGAFLVMGARP